MNINELVPLKKGKVVVDEENNVILPEKPIVKYALVDTSKYSFEYKYDDDIDVNMYESDREFDCDEFIDAEFEEEISEVDYSYYVVAVASGLLTGAFSQFKLTEKKIEKITEWKTKDWDKYVSIAAQISGYKKKDVKGAYDFLMNRVVPFVDESLKKEVDDSIKKALNTLSSHPTLAGLAFSVFTQFSEQRYIIGETGLIMETLPEYYAIGRNPEEKIVYGLLYWIFNLGVDVTLSKRRILDDLKIPKEIINLLKEVCKLQIYADIPTNYCEAEKTYSGLIQNLFKDSKYKDENGAECEFDLKSLIHELENKSVEGSVPVIINECIVRTFYLLKKVIKECKEKEVATLEDLKNIDVEKVLPFNNRLVSKMILISSGCFLGVNVAGATVKALIAQETKTGGFTETLLAEISIAGVGRFVFAVIADSKYWSDDIEVILQRRNKNNSGNEKAEEQKVVDDMISNDAFKVLSFDAAQARALYSMESLIVIKDIEHTKSIKDKENKQKWFETWQSRLLTGMNIDFDDYFIVDEKLVYEAFNHLEESEENLRWFYLMAMELVLFTPYYPLGVKEDSVFKKLKCEKYNYMDDQFVRRQTIISQAEVDSIRSSYKKYKNIVGGNTKNVAIAAGVAAATVAGGGIALAFAPAIATMIAGEAVVGLHGAALASASLAFVGGGSLAAGGLGMAGGTAIITGGGAILGMAGSGAASMAAILSQTSSEYWIRQTSKMLVFCNNILKARLNLKDAIKKLSLELDETIRNVEKNTKELEQEKCSLDKTVIKNSKDCLKYLNKCKSELEKMLK